MVMLGGGYEAKSRVTFDRKGWVPLHTKPRFPDLSIFESRAVLSCLVYYGVFSGSSLTSICWMAVISFKL